jgi:hypothetical protein
MYQDEPIQYGTIGSIRPVGCNAWTTLYILNKNYSPLCQGTVLKEARVLSKETVKHSTSQDDFMILKQAEGEPTILTSSELDH